MSHTESTYQPTWITVSFVPAQAKKTAIWLTSPEGRTLREAQYAGVLIQHEYSAEPPHPPMDSRTIAAHWDGTELQPIEDCPSFLGLFPVGVRPTDIEIAKGQHDWAEYIEAHQTRRRAA